MTRPLRRTVSSSIAALALAACAPLPVAAPAAVGPVGVEWRLEAMPGAVRADVEGPRGAPTLRLDGAGRAAGSGGVNRWSAAAVVEGDAIRLSNPIATRMAGPPEAMALEAEFLGRLQRAARWRVDGGRLRLSDASGAELMTLRPAEPR